MKNITYALSFFPYVLMSGLAYFLYQKFGKPKILDVEDNRVKEQSIVLMSNGMSYVQMSETLFFSMFSGSWAGDFLFNVDEKALGTLMKDVKKNEYRNLESVYKQYKDAKNPYITISRGGTLTDDLLKAFNRKEQKEYLSHLLNL